MNTMVCREIIESIKEISNPTKEDINRAKLRIAGKHSLQHVPSNSHLIRHLRSDEESKLLPVLRRKKVRSISGVTVVAVMTKPFPCPKDNPCAYCPGGPPQGSPQSYTGHEPAAMRGAQNEFDPYQQVRHRIEQLKAIGHPVDKVEFIIMGGTFPAMPLDYQERFIKRCLDAINPEKSCSLVEAKKQAEDSQIHNVGITVETRPDWAKESHVDHMLSMGVTRVELGVQNLYEDIYQLVDRGHTVGDVVEATRILKDAGLKICYHMMPGLPGSNYQRDLRGFKTIFTDSSFKPDMLKIYPCLVLKGTKAYDWWRDGEYEPYTTEEAAELILEVKKLIPPWIRIMRIQRDIPANLIEAGVDRSNLRQIVLSRLSQDGLQCGCIRCREVGHQWLKEGINPDPEEIELLIRKEPASEGEEIFISAEDTTRDLLIGYLRLRIPSERAHRPEIASEAASIVRELHIYGPLVPVGTRSVQAWQHRGYGETLLSKAEQISSQDYDRRKIVVISGLGAKQYYKRLGYDYDGPYISKSLER
ncbi:tRNA uridine(34) 5-carboxymethylaminomethyl modification radical SAM/GNAT enzyme Elp3 [Candidatus Bathyarchaeota archaeon]|nr:tRNA uridine(34) 5-carboxymethylaminomethyl modification radical SAM/GNAT enzyme Elp3 [Candidatus Bathyarchaeota archaeon]NIU81157.1 tRNA uridine(34) 5-carboxymethylaminomethyl modification radical SAM/GNAT enzyme Elp3 [Candidatus Bathyarchaeota archaeon]NIV67783.1 tRNA uridine(34) 5-carboxymethylaminomethyl modification radical SAM/GNAT enzyme Elp3 [Candidatus Bathyarchaeota archaeon]NIW16277.1 tRNA uridine(34) 5-carboxymethylaminomethyl modification radical SAM/GNAT enzyme Elp3 [Candidatus 